MKKNLYLIAAAVLLLCVLGFRLQSRPQQWEYHSEIFGKISEAKLNQLGAEGWELVGVGSANDINQFIFKRPKP